MFNKTVELVSETFIEDDIGQMIATPSYREVFADKKSIMQNEFFLAGQTDIKPSACFIIRQIDYKDETKIRYPADYTGKIYTIYRTYETTKNEMIELYCEVRSGANS